MAVPEWNEETIAEFAVTVEESAGHNRDQAIAWRRWSLAACLTLNGAASISSLNIELLSPNSLFWANIWFVAGLCFTIIYGFACAWNMDAFAGHYKQSAWRMRRQDPLAPLDIDRALLLNKWERRIDFVQFAALPCFLVGFAILLEGLP